MKPAYSHAPWKNPKYPPGCMCEGKRSPAKVLDGKASTAIEAKEGGALAAPTIAQSWSMFPLIAGFTTFWKILR